VCDSSRLKDERNTCLSTGSSGLFSFLVSSVSASENKLPIHAAFVIYSIINVDYRSLASRLSEFEMTQARFPVLNSSPIEKEEVMKLPVGRLRANRKIESKRLASAPGYISVSERMTRLIIIQ